jgi:peroxiredoxin
MNVWKWIGVVAMVAIPVGIIWLGQSSAAEADKESRAKAELGKKAPDFTLKDVYGKDFKLSDFKEKIVVLEWINRECPVSRGCHDKEVMQKVYKKYAGKGVVWLAIDSTASAKPEDNRVYAAQQGLSYPILHDPDGKVGRAYDARRTPHMFVIDKSGKLVYDGAIDDQGKINYVADAIEAVLANKEVARPKTEPYGCSIKYAPLKKG